MMKLMSVGVKADCRPPGVHRLREAEVILGRANDEICTTGPASLSGGIRERHAESREADDMMDELRHREFRFAAVPPPRSCRRTGAFAPRRRSSFSTVGGMSRHPQAFA